ncbi:lipid-A-disaccharide kinase [Pseudoxanthomonas sp. GM95]|uniref:tetraacyldisaccharide 4'-kinase n=1 Tax=Pseudoxanthomonas sp. GM95 TaxID=1881043 RepID=UPI0008D08418|nr:tetraacyldisaccharide 4'-kinase [Pseudoxanthomonas sp. GM95]SEK93402.1 lipid-A-disaccharide kinase [Pseudoxanthomonas sp. GM95]
MSKAPKTPRHWFDGAPVPPLAGLLEPIYASALKLRGALFRLHLLARKRAPVPVIVVGNVTVGGTGKTPLTIALVQRLRDAGWTPGVASRGYGRNDEASPRWVDLQTTPADGGDEPVLIARRTGVRVRVDRDRVAAARALAAEGCDIVVCDDGLQHYRLRRDLEIEVIDGRRRYGNGRLLPAGPLREPAARGLRCDFRVVNGGAAGFGEWPMTLQSECAVPMTAGKPLPLAAFSGHRVHAVAGIGNPARFFDMLRDYGIGVVPHAFDDHQAYTAQDLQFGSDLPLLMTEKDAVKCAGLVGDWAYSVPIEAALPEAFWVALEARLLPLRAQAARRTSKRGKA